MLIEGITLHAFDTDRWVVHTQQERNFLVNRATYQLIQVLKNCSNTSEAVVKFNSLFQTSLNSLQFEELIAEKLGGYYILKDDSQPEKPTLKNQYLKLKVRLINARWAGWLSKPFQVFYSPNVFWWALLGVILTVVSVYFMSDNKLAFTNINYPLFLGLVYSAMLIHELGHIGACAKYGLKHGGIGFGFYFVLPVMYADVTNIWLANKERRVIANMGGIFSELLYAAILILLFFLTGNHTFYAEGISIALFVIWQFNPFVRFDGYWILSDLINTPNLLPKANVVFKTLIKTPMVLLRSNQKTVLLFVYGLTNTGFFIAIMSYMLVTQWNIIINFPFIVFNLLKKALFLKFTWSDLNRQFITVFIFYSLLLRLLYSQYKRRFSTVNS